ncbi:hypothetical protein ANCCAN_12689 [Ancylostoma caninum]|uniref:Uncharacterized protein n=1 Tax=Ancylostoma caninum TaxID=29170 RepID=A0A368GCD5_ANCCA|nr:hypothetical protein ANCCAN_12689 [Ancylostoma caninum]
MASRGPQRKWTVHLTVPISALSPLRKGCHRKQWTPRARADGGGGVYEAIYACAVEDQCLGIGCMKAFRATKCCCNSDYCNTCSSIPLTAAIVPMMVVKLIIF